MPADAAVLPAAVSLRHGEAGPRFGEDVWDVRRFVPRTTPAGRVDFSMLTDPMHVRTAKEYLYSRLHRGLAVNRLAGSARPMKLTGLVTEFWKVRTILTDLARVGAPRLAEVSAAHLAEVLAGWKRHPETAALLVGAVKHLAAHGAFLTDRLSFTPWPSRSANVVAGRRSSTENATPRIPEHWTAPLLQAAVFYVQTASVDLLAARAELAELHRARDGHRVSPAEARERLDAFVAARRAAGRGIPALPASSAHKRPGAVREHGVVQAPNAALIALLAGVPRSRCDQDELAAAGAELGYEQGGLDTVMSLWPATGQCWRPRLDPWSLKTEVTQLRTACWIVIAYLSGMRDAEVRELSRECAVVVTGIDGRIRHKLRGRVFKDRTLAGEEADWVVLDIVHRAVEVLLAVNDDPTHLFGYTHGGDFELLSNMSVRLAVFAAHAEELLGEEGRPFLPGYRDGEETDRWAFTPRQFRRTLAWHIAHQPFGVVAGARQYKHAQVAVFEGYAGTSASGFAAEVEAEQASARLDYAESLYRDWVHGEPTGGGAAAGVNAEFARIQAELADLPGTVADRARLRAMLDHLAVTLHPGVLGDCFYRPETALCAKHSAVPLERPAPLLHTCLSCPNARRTSVHLPRLEQARTQARELLRQSAGRSVPPLQRQALSGHLDQITQLIEQVGGAGYSGTQSP